MSIYEEVAMYETLAYEGRYEEECFLSAHHDLTANEKRDLYCYAEYVMKEGASLIEACAKLFIAGRIAGVRLEQNK